MNAVNGSAPFRVDWSAVKPAIRRIRDSVMHSETQRLRLADALEETDRLLSVDPIGMGEPKFELKHLKLLVCIGFNQRYRIEYGVHTASHQVFVRTFTDMGS